MHQISWTDAALDDLDQIFEYHLEHVGAHTAENIYNRIKTQVASLKTFPYRTRPGQVPGTREYVLTRLPYLVIVEIVDPVVWVAGVVHSSRRYPPSPFDEDLGDW